MQRKGRGHIELLPDGEIIENDDGNFCVELHAAHERSREP
jgi:hypothetical protein